MKLKMLMTDRDSMKIEYYKSVLEEYGMKCQCSNIFLSSLTGTFYDWPELWVLEEDFEKASKIIEGLKISP